MSPRTPRLAIAGLILVAAVCVRLGFWQLDRLHHRRAANRVALSARAEPPFSASGTELSGAATWPNHRVVASGRYDHDREIVLRGASLDGVPGVQVVTPLRITGSDSAILVNRGFVPAPDAVSAWTEPLREPGEQRVEGIALALSAGGGKPLGLDERTTWARLDLAALRQRLPYPILPVYILQSPSPGLPSFPRRLPAPPLDDGPHLSYTIQWFFFAVMAVGFGVVIGRSSLAGPGRPNHDRRTTIDQTND
jgi:surfeit locus 1 family protein